MDLDTCLPKFDIYQGIVASNCFKSCTNSWCPDFFKKKTCLISSLKFTLSDVTLFLPDNLSGIKKIYIQACIDYRLPKNDKIILKMCICLICCCIVLTSFIIKVAFCDNTTQKMKFSNKDFFSKCDFIFTEEIFNKNFILCTV